MDQYDKSYFLHINVLCICVLKKVVSTINISTSNDDIKKLYHHWWDSSLLKDTKSISQQNNRKIFIENITGRLNSIQNSKLRFRDMNIVSHRNGADSVNNESAGRVVYQNHHHSCGFIVYQITTIPSWHNFHITETQFCILYNLPVMFSMNKNVLEEKTHIKRTLPLPPVGSNQLIWESLGPPICHT